MSAQNETLYTFAEDDTRARFTRPDGTTYRAVNVMRVWVNTGTYANQGREQVLIVNTIVQTKQGRDFKRNGHVWFTLEDAFISPEFKTYAEECLSPAPEAAPAVSRVSAARKLRATLNPPVSDEEFTAMLQSLFVPDAAALVAEAFRAGRR